MSNKCITTSVNSIGITYFLWRHFWNVCWVALAKTTPEILEITCLRNTVIWVICTWRPWYGLSVWVMNLFIVYFRSLYICKKYHINVKCVINIICRKWLKKKNTNTRYKNNWYLNNCYWPEVWYFLFCLSTPDCKTSTLYQSSHAHLY